MLWSRKFQTVFRAFATKAVGNAVKTTVTAVAKMGVSALTAALIGDVAKGLIETLVARASQVETKLDRLLREPLLTGLMLLKDGLEHDRSSPDEERAREAVLDHAHVSLTRALALVIDSREDSIFVRSLDCVALAAHRGHRSLARSALGALQNDLSAMASHVALLEAEAAEWIHDSQTMYDYFARDPFGDKPHGHLEQRHASIRFKNAAARVQARAIEARDHLDILQGIVSIAERFIDAPAA